MTSGNITATFAPIVYQKENLFVPLFTVKEEARQRSGVYPQSIKAWELGRNGKGELCLRGYGEEPVPISSFKEYDTDEYQYVLCDSGKLYVFSVHILVYFKDKEKDLYEYKITDENSAYNYVGHLTFAAADYYLDLHKQYDSKACKKYFEDEQNVQKVSVIMAGLLTFNKDGKSVKWANTGSGHFKPADKDYHVLQRVQDVMIKVLRIGNEQTKFGDHNYCDFLHDKKS
jgi:hypothetical protein